MTGPLEERFVQSLRDRARGLSAERDIAGEAVAQARRIRRRRRAGTAVAGVALVAIAIPIGWNATGGGGNDRTEFEPIQTPTQSAEPTSPDDEPRGQDGDGSGEHIRRSLDFSELTQGDPPTIPYLADGAIHDGDARIPFDERQVDTVRAIAGGYVVSVYGLQGSRLVLVRPDGTTERLNEEEAPVFAVSSDGGQRIAWAETPPELDRSTLVVADGATGEQRHTLPLDQPADVLGWVRGRVAFEYQDLSEFRLWDPETGKVTTVDGTVGGGATDGVELAAVYTEFQEAESRLCGAVIDVGSGSQELWSSCEQLVTGFSPDGRYAVTNDSRTDGLGPGRINVVEAATGRPVLTLDADVFYKVGWEPDGSLLAEVAEGGQYALVRCSLDGDCELATSPVAYPYEDQPGDPRPHVIGQQ